MRQDNSTQASRTTRRDFLKKTGIVAAGGVVGSFIAGLPLINRAGRKPAKVTFSKDSVFTPARDKVNRA
ncbi:MAG: twin-arginine translocation signal domain-containing protein [SAR202 cluster bacterium]|nr:twin-arginine translocation signal domain-containing protein [SAR202 cluster bacterium]